MLRPPKTKQEKLKFLIALGMIAPSAVRTFLPGVEIAESAANIATLVAGLMWLLEA